MSTPTAVPFVQVPSNLEVPGAYMEFNSANANNGATAASYRLLIMGQMLAGGTATPLVPTRIVSGKAQADVLFGQGSMLSNMVAGAVVANNLVEMWALPVLDNAGGAAATGSILLTGTATASGVITAYIGYSGLISPAQVSVATGQTAAVVAAALAAAIAAALDLPVTATVAVATITITARHKGIEAGAIDIRVLYQSTDVLPAGLTATVTSMSGGTLNPTPTAMIAALSDVRYDVIACPWNDAATYAAWVIEMTRRWNALVGKEGCIVTAFHGSPGTIGTQLASMNSQWHDCYGSQNAPTPSFVECAVIAAVYCTNLQNQPNAPQKGTLLPNIAAPAQADQLTFAQRQLQYLEGGACWKASSSGIVAIEKAVTTYKTNASGAADTSYHGRWVMATLTFLRRSWMDWMALRFPTATFADDGTPVVAGEVTPKILGLSTIAWYNAMMTRGLVQNLAGFKGDLASIRNITNHARNDQLLGPRLVGPLDIIAGQMAFQE
jgi:phage tail sheath gpL-like